MTTRLEQLRANAESVRAQFEDGRASLYRADGSKVYGDDEHAERLAGLRGQRNATLDTIEGQLASEVESANEDIAAFDNGGPTAWLTRDEKGQASASHALVAADVATLSRDELEERLSVVAASGDRAIQTSYWLAARGVVSASEDVRMLEALDNLKEELAIPNSSLRSRVEAARRSLHEAHEVERVVWLARREQREVYAPNYSIHGR